eukprot:CAMPEP_0194281096 /NCGR_PEP_ID=MMETSP0169-20130528/19841_1 /TAXON_ID=218684 /ORGANISM="Corethron pennatum, Strain L29A3" /LENGTH=442 /DNA_ID=CAMNT_0039026055 /DNA_START=58 /DNA_END=1386 /DNA_ORIENTATION=+
MESMEQDARQRLYNEIGQMRSNSANSTISNNMYMNSVEMAQASMAPNQVYQGGSFNRLLGNFSNGNNQQNIPSNMSSSLTFPPNSQRFMVPRMYDNELPHSGNFMNGDNCVLPGLNSQHQHMCDRYRQINHHDHIALLNQLDSGFASSNQSHKSHQSLQSHPSHSSQQSLQQSQYCQLNTLRSDHQRTSSAPPQSMISSMGSSLKGMIGERNIENVDGSPASSFVKIQDQQLHKPQHTQNEASGFQALQGPAAAEEAAKKSSVHYFPCRAKGMDLDHNFETAFFSISENTPHGTELYCSHPLCKSGGCKFRYCAICKAPAARRNFRKRHEHAGNDQNPKTKREKSSSEKVPAKRQRSGAMKNVMSKSDPGRTMSVSSDTSALTESGTSWNDVLNERPDSDDEVSISAWIKKVLSVSNKLKKPPSRSNSSSSNINTTTSSGDI